MIKIKILIISLGILCTLSSNAQEEFFRKNTGLSVSGSTDFSATNTAGLSLHLKSRIIFSGTFLLSNGGSNIPSIATIGYLFDLNKKSEKDKLNALFSLSHVSYDFFSLGYISPTLGIMYTSYQNGNYPTSIGLSASAYFYKFNFDNIEQSNATLYFAQAFFAKKTVYPLIGFTYSVPLTNAYGYSEGSGSFQFHVGLNIRLSKPENAN